MLCFIRFRWILGNYQEDLKLNRLWKFLKPFSTITTSFRPSSKPTNTNSSSKPPSKLVNQQITLFNQNSVHLHAPSATPLLIIPFYLFTLFPVSLHPTAHSHSIMISIGMKSLENYDKSFHKSSIDNRW